MNGPAVTPSPLERPAPPAGASVEGPKGIGGWLLLPLLGLVMSIWFIARNLLELNGLRGADEWLSGRPLLGQFGDRQLAVDPLPQCLVRGRWTARPLCRGPARSPSSFAVAGCPPAIAAFYIALVVAAGVDVVFVSFLPVGGLTPDSLRGAWTQLVRALVAGAIWSLYFSMSKRVRNTFVR